MRDSWAGYAAGRSRNASSFAFASRAQACQPLTVLNVGSRGWRLPEMVSGRESDGYRAEPRAEVLPIDDRRFLVLQFRADSIFRILIWAKPT